MFIEDSEGSSEDLQNTFWTNPQTSHFSSHFSCFESRKSVQIHIYIMLKQFLNAHLHLSLQKNPRLQKSKVFETNYHVLVALSPQEQLWEWGCEALFCFPPRGVPSSEILEQCVPQCIIKLDHILTPEESNPTETCTSCQTKSVANQKKLQLPHRSCCRNSKCCHE